MLSLDQLQVVVYRAGLAAVLAYGVVDSMRTLRVPDRWLPHGLARLPGVTGLARVGPRRVLAMVFAAGAVGFVTEWSPLLSTLAMAVPFLLITSLQHSLPWTGYSIQDDDGNTLRQIYHHLHLAGLCALAALAAETIAFARGWNHARSGGVDPADTLFVQLVWAAIAAHYFISAATKLRVRGLGWVDRQLFPYYIHLFDCWQLGDTGRSERHFVASFILAHPAVGAALLGGALACEAAALLYPFNAVARVLVGTGLVAFHVLSARVLHITFYENLALVLVFTYEPVRWAAGAMGGSDIPAVAPTSALPALVAIALIVGVSVVVAERLYPFSTLAMFTSPLRAQGVVLIRIEGDRVLPAPECAGATTSGLSREYAVHRAGGGNDETFVDMVEQRIAAASGDPHAVPPHTLFLRTVSIDGSGTVGIYERPLTSKEEASWNPRR